MYSKKGRNYKMYQIKGPLHYVCTYKQALQEDNEGHTFSTYEPNQSGPKKGSPLTEPLSHVQLYICTHHIGRAKTTQVKENKVSR